MTTDGPTSLNCPTCGAPLDVDGTRVLVRCKFCGNTSLLPGHAASAPDLDEIRQLAGSGNLAEAIEQYAQAYGVDLHAAAQAIDALQAGRLATPAAPGMGTSAELTRALEEVQRKLQAGNKIGAIKVYREHYDVSLARAKYAIEQIEAGQMANPEAGFQTLTASTQTTSYSSISIETPQSARPARRGIGGIIVTAIVLLFVAGLVGLILFAKGGPLNPHYYPIGPVAAVPSTQDAVVPDFALGLYNPDKDTRFIGLVDGLSGKLRWQAAPLSGNGIADAIVSSTDLVYAANDADLLAYRKSDGSLAWQVQMPDRLNYGAATLLVTAGRVITNNSDQTIQAYDAATGKLAWSKRLKAYDRSLRMIGPSLVVIDYVDSDNNYGLLFVDPASGALQTVITPTCTSNDYTTYIDTDTGLVYDQAGNELYLFYDSSYGCVQRIDLASGQTAWQADSKNNFNFMSGGFQFLMTGSTVYFSSGNDLLAVEKSSGTMKVLLTNPDYDLVPLAMAGDKLIVRARRTRGSERFELWGLEAASGSQAWQMDMQGAAPIDPPNAMSGLIDDTSPGWIGKLTPGGLVIMKFQGNPNQLVLETFNPADGTSLGKKTLALKNVSGDFYDIPKAIGWQGNVVYLRLEQNIYSLDITTGGLKIIY